MSQLHEGVFYPKRQRHQCDATDQRVINLLTAPHYPIMQPENKKVMSKNNKREMPNRCPLPGAGGDLGSLPSLHCTEYSCRFRKNCWRLRWKACQYWREKICGLTLVSILVNNSWSPAASWQHCCRTATFGTEHLIHTAAHCASSPGTVHFIVFFLSTLLDLLDFPSDSFCTLVPLTNRSHKRREGASIAGLFSVEGFHFFPLRNQEQWIGAQ
jgi:hypothetical protein